MRSNQHCPWLDGEGDEEKILTLTSHPMMSQVAAKAKNPVKKLVATVPEGALLQLAATECKELMADL